MDTLKRFPKRRDDVAGRVIGGEAVVVTPSDSQVHELNPVATFIWERCDGTRSGLAIAAEITAEFDVQAEMAERDLVGLLRTLCEKGLIVLLEAPVPPSPVT